MSTLNFHKSCRSIVVLSRYCGLSIPHDDEDTKRSRVMLSLISIILTPFLIWKTFCSVSNTFENSFEDRIIAQSCDILFLTGLALTLFYRIFCRRLGILITDIDNICKKITQNKIGVEDNFISMYNDRTKLFTLLFKILSVSSTVLPFLYCSSGVLATYINGEEALTLPVPVNCAFESSYRVLFEVFAFLQFSGLALPALQKLGNDFLLYQVMKIQVNCFKYINESLSEIEKCIYKHPRVPVRFKLIKCIKIHQHIVRNVRDLQSLFSPVIILYLVGILTLTASGLFYQLNAENVNLVQSGTLGGYMFITVLQLYLLCHMADEITVEAEKIAIAMYCIPWYMLDKADHIIISMTINMGQKTLKMTAYKTSALNISKEAFVAFIINLVSAYMGFRKVQNLEEKGSQ
nr:olfactory receptor 81 [Tropidothorax elegans]